MGRANAAQRAKQLQATPEMEKLITEQTALIEQLSLGLTTIYDELTEYEGVLEEETLDDIFGIALTKTEVTAQLEAIDSWREKNNIEILNGTTNEETE